MQPAAPAAPLRSTIVTTTLLARNEGGADRAIRVLVGLALLALAFIGPKTPWGFLGIIPLATGLTGTCLIYRLFGISTCAPKAA